MHVFTGFTRFVCYRGMHVPLASGFIFLKKSHLFAMTFCRQRCIQEIAAGCFGTCFAQEVDEDE